MSAYLGLDFGEKRIGVAVSDETLTIASSLKHILFRGRAQVLGELKPLFEEYRIVKIIAGLPKTMKGELGLSAQKVMTHVDWFKANTRIEWVLWDERLTTRQVERVLLDADLSRDKRREVRDGLAAQCILQAYLDYEKSSGSVS